MLNVRWIVGVTVLLGWITAGCAFAPVDGEPTGSSESAISGGEPAPEEWAVVGLLTGHGSCSGTLIAPNLVLTAHHCVADTPEGNVLCGKATFGPVYTNPLSVTTRDTVFATWRQRVQSVEVPPDSGDVCGGDVAVMFLEENVEASEAWPRPPRIDEDPVPEELYRAVGFGGTQEDGTGAGTRRQRDGLTVRCVGDGCPLTFQVQANEWMGETGICPGDSGGPALDEEGRVIGVTSRGGVNCSTPIYSGVAPWADWLKEMGAKAAEQGGYEPWPWVTGGTTLAPDPPDPEEDAGVDAEPAPAADTSGASGGCSLRPAGESPLGAWAALLAGGVALALQRRRRAEARARHRSIALAAGAILGLGVVSGGCRCGPSEDELPSNRASPSSSGPASAACPARPAWAGALDGAAELEVLHAAEAPSGPHGTGYRLHGDGRFETYDDIDVGKDDAGRVTFKKVPGSWRDRGVVTEETRAAVKKQLAEAKASDVTGLQVTKVEGGKAFTLISVRREGKLVESCYYGQEAPSSSDAVVKTAHDLMNRLKR